MMYNVHHHIVFSGSRTQKIGEEGGIGKRSEKIVGTVLKGQGKRGGQSGEEGGIGKRAEKIVGTVLKGQGKRGNQSGEEGKAVAGGGDATGAWAPPF